MALMIYLSRVTMVKSIQWMLILTNFQTYCTLIIQQNIHFKTKHANNEALYQKEFSAKRTLKSFLKRSKEHIKDQQ